jgi:hypothetical protein
MDTERVPTLAWPTNLFRDSADVDLFESLANPFLEVGDFVAATELLWHSPRIAPRECALAA